VKPNIYERDGNLYHGECAVGVVLDTLEENPLTEQWAKAFEFSDNTSRDLTRIARYMGINRRSPEQVKEARFPVQISKTPDPPSLCSACLNFFARSEAESEASDV
jgi:hypothetical protein